MLVSVIIPTFNEEARIGNLAAYIRDHCEGGSQTEIIVADGFSTDDTPARAAKAGARVVVAPKGRALQMNSGAAVAQGEVLFFLHADTIPPPSFIKDILQANEEGYSAGCYQLAFDHDHWFLRFNSWFTRFDFTPFRFGDQGLFVNKHAFRRISGFNPALLLMEDQEIIWRLKRLGKFKIFNEPVVTSARKYLENGIFKLQFIFILIYFLYELGISQNKLMDLYKRMIRDERIEPGTPYFFRKSETAASVTPPIANKLFQ